MRRPMATSPSRRPNRGGPSAKPRGPRWGFVVYQIGIVVLLSTFVVVAVNLAGWLLPGEIDWKQLISVSVVLSLGGVILILAGRLLMKRNMPGGNAAMRGAVNTSDADPMQPPSGRRSIPPNMPTPIMKVRCQSCQSLNDEANKFCGHCGQPLSN